MYNNLMNNEEKELIEKMVTDDRPSALIPSMTINDLKRYSRINLKKRKNPRKFLKRPARYVRDGIWAEYLAHIMVLPIIRSLNYNEIGKKLIMIDELPQGVYTKYQTEVVKTGNEILAQQDLDKQLAFKAQIVNFDQPNLNGNIYTKEALEDIDFTKANCNGFHIISSSVTSKGVEITVKIEGKE